MEETQATDLHFTLINDQTGNEFVIAEKDYVKICKEHNVSSFKDIPEVFIDYIVSLPGSHSEVSLGARSRQQIKNLSIKSTAIIGNQYHVSWVKAWPLVE